MSAREQILARITAARGGTSGTDERSHEQSCVPAVDVGGNLIGRFIERAIKLASDVVRVAEMSETPTAVARYCELHALSCRAVCWPALSSLPWREQGLEVEVRAARGDDAIGITGAFAAVAETGTLILLSGTHTPAAASLLPETHIAVVSATCIVATMEDAWARMRAQWGAIPRAVNFISGPSRTADVEQTVTLGAHGPRRVLIVLVGG